jgi:xylulokinase
MEYIAAFDIGTTSTKGILVARDGSIHGSITVSLDTIFDAGGSIEQDPEQWWLSIQTIAGQWWKKGFSPESIAAIIFSGQMQDCIPIDEFGKPVRNAILYSDGRADCQARQILKRIGEAEIRQITGNHFDGTMVFPKILWMLEQETDNYQRTNCFLVSSKDYVIRQLTGRNIADPTTGATTGMMKLDSREWMFDWIQKFGISGALLPQILSPGEIVAYVDKTASQLTGFSTKTPVLCGIGDAGAATIGAGAVKVGEIYAYIGTTGWVAIPTRNVNPKGNGIFNLAHYPSDLLIAIAPLTNAGNVHKWAATIFSCGLNAADKTGIYSHFEESIVKAPPGAHGVTFLPYLNGERCPVQDANASGCFAGLTELTTKEDMCRAVLEGVAMSIRQVMDLLIGGQRIERLVLVGGGSKAETWCQIIADVCRTEVVVPLNAEFLPSLGVTSIAFERLNWSESYEKPAKEWVMEKTNTVFFETREHEEIYDQIYRKFIMLYPALKPIFDLNCDN